MATAMTVMSTLMSAQRPMRRRFDGWVVTAVTV
jgi:hypothetical protein